MTRRRVGARAGRRRRARAAAAGHVQTLKARAQGRRGTSPLQPYRSCGGCGARAPSTPAGDRPVYRLAPALVAACLLAALRCCPIGGRGAGLGLGHDAFVLVGLLALARFALAAAAWDTGNGFALMGAARDLMLAVFAEALFVLALLLAAQPAQQHRPGRDERRGGGSEIWREPRTGAGCWRSRSSSSPRPAASRSTTPTRISS